MSCFQIYIPNGPEDGTGEDRVQKACQRVGLDGWDKGANIQPVQGSQGPDGGAGTLLAWFKAGKPMIGIRAKEKQDWVQSPKGYWVGFWNDHPMTEEDLRLPNAREGKWITLNGDKWLLTTPDTLLRFADYRDGKLTWVTDEKFNWLVHDIDKRRAKAIEAGDGETFRLTFDDETDFLFLCDVLAINYRITPEAVGKLRLLDKKSMSQIIAGLMGMELL